jgi:hypothetical protein
LQSPCAQCQYLEMQPGKMLVSCSALLAIGLASGAPVTEAEIRPAVGKSVALLQEAGETWLEAWIHAA